MTKTTFEAKKPKVTHSIGNFYKDKNGFIYLLVQDGDTAVTDGVKVALLSFNCHILSETKTSVKNQNNITEEEFKNICGHTSRYAYDFTYISEVKMEIF